MKRCNRCLSLVLILCLLSVLPLCAAAAEEYDACVTGSWALMGSVDPSTEEYTAMDAAASSLIIREDGTGIYYIAKEGYAVKWAFNSSTGSGYIYNIELNYQGARLPLSMKYCASGDMEGRILLSMGNVLYAYKKA